MLFKRQDALEWKNYFRNNGTESLFQFVKRGKIASAPE